MINEMRRRRRRFGEAVNSIVMASIGTFCVKNAVTQVTVSHSKGSRGRKRAKCRGRCRT